MIIYGYSDSIPNTNNDDDYRMAAVMENMSQGSLRHVLDTIHSTMTLLQKIQIAKDVSEAILFLHDTSIAISTI